MNGHILGEDGGSGQMAQWGKWHRNADEAVSTISKHVGSGTLGICFKIKVINHKVFGQNKQDVYHFYSSVKKSMVLMRRVTGRGGEGP